ncbi:hypothetical protein [Parabacteroides sp.]
MENTILLRLRERIPEGCSSVKEIEKICQDVTFDVLSASYGEEEVRNILRELCGRLHFSVRTKERQLPEQVQSKEAPFSLKGILSYLLAGAAYYVGYVLSESHLVGGVACVAVGALGGKYLNPKKANASLEISVPLSIEVCSTVEELAEEVERVVELLENSISLSEGEKQVNPEDMLEKRYPRILRYLYDNYMECISKESLDQFQLKTLESLFKRSGYELVQYTEEKASCFNSSWATTVSERTTTAPALLNTQTGDCILKGHVLYPQIVDKNQ